MSSELSQTQVAGSSSTIASYEEFFRERTGRMPFKYQTAVWRGICERRNIILRAPTGAGKTWAVLIPFLHSIYSNRAASPNRLIYALPLRTLAQGVYREAKEVAAKMGFPLEGRMERGREVVRPFVTMQTGEQPDDPFFDRGRIVVTTYDQVLSGLLDGPYGLSCRLHNINAAAVAGSLVVFDEFHLMEPQRAFLTAVAGLRLFRELCQSVWMTATATHPLECALNDALGTQRIPADFEEEKELLNSLPAVTTVARNLAVEDHPLTADDVIRWHSNRSIVLLNTVSRAQEMFTALRSKIATFNRETELILLHSRFFRNDRAAKEEKLMSLFGEGSEHSAMLIATQVVEAGLDISCEQLHSELCPMNALIQRAGRCARFPHEEGTVHVYPLPSGKRNWLPYEDRGQEAESLKKTRSVLERVKHAKLDARLAAEWVQKAHSDEDEQALRQGWGSRLSECLRRIEQNAIVRNTVRVADLIREDDADLVSLIIAEERTLPETPNGKEGLTVRRRGLSKLIRDHAEEIGWVWDCSDGLGWKPLKSAEDLLVGYAVCVKPRVVAYDDQVGVRLGVVGSKESPDREQPPRPGYRPLRLEAWTNHALAVAQEVTSRLEKECGYGSLLQVGLKKRYGLSVDAIAQAMRLCALLHDLGKLQEPWQQWAEASQRARDPQYRHKTLLAHTDFDPDRQKDRQQERALGLTRPPHAAAGAYYGVLIAAAFIEPDVVPDVRDRLASACTAAILAHHGGWIPSSQRNGRDLGISSLHPASRDALAEVVGEKLNLAALGKLESQGDRQRFLERWVEPATAAENLGAWWPLVAYFTRTLRLSDQRATSETGTDDE